MHTIAISIPHRPESLTLTRRLLEFTAQSVEVLLISTPSTNETEAQLQAEDAEWDAVFASKSTALADLAGVLRKRIAAGEATPLDMQAV